MKAFGTTAQKDQHTIRDQQKALRRARWQLAAAATALVIVLAVMGWREYQYRKIAAIEKKTAVQAKEAAITQRNELFAHMSGRFETIQQHLNKGISNTQEIRDLVQHFSQPSSERQQFETELEALRTQIQAVEAARQRDAVSYELDTLQQDTGETSALRDTDTVQQYISARVPQDGAPDIFRDFWDTGAALAQSEIRKQLIEFTRDYLSLREHEFLKGIDRQVVSDEITTALYQLSLQIEKMSFPLDNRYSVSSWNLTRRDLRRDIPWDFKNAKTWEIENQIRDLRETSQKLQSQIWTTYKSVFDVGREAEIEYVQESLQKKEHDLQTIQQQLTRMQSNIDRFQSDRTTTLASLETHLKAASNESGQAHAQLAELQGELYAFLAENAFRDHNYQAAIPYYVKTLLYAPDDPKSSYNLVFSLMQAREQDNIPCTFFTTVVQDLVRLSETLVDTGIVRDLDRHLKKNLSRMYFEFSECFVKCGEFEHAIFANNHALTIAELVKNNEKNLKVLRKRQQELRNAVK